MSLGFHRLRNLYRCCCCQCLCLSLRYPPSPSLSLSLSHSTHPFCKQLISSVRSHGTTFGFGPDIFLPMLQNAYTMRPCIIVANPRRFTNILALSALIFSLDRFSPPPRLGQYQTPFLFFFIRGMHQSRIEPD